MGRGVGREGRGVGREERGGVERPGSPEYTTTMNATTY